MRRGAVNVVNISREPLRYKVTVVFSGISGDEGEERALLELYKKTRNNWLWL
jgi:hypothetical protein